MRLAVSCLTSAALASLVSMQAQAAPPALPEGQPEAAPPADPPSAEAAPTEAAPTPPPAAASPADDPGLDLGGSIEADGEISASGADADVESDRQGRRNRRRRGADRSDDEAATIDDPGMVQGRREPTMLTNRGAVGLFHTTLPDAGGRYTFRFRVNTSFFRKDGFIFEGADGSDTHARVMGGVAMSFSPLEWGELFFSVNSSANRNERPQADRQDAEAIFALGDLDFGIKGAHRFKNKGKGIGLGGQLGVGLLSGSERLLTSNVNFWFDVLFAVDVRYMTPKHFPFRFTTNLGWMLDNSLRVVDYAAITDPTSREVSRFSLGGNHNRVRMRYAIDFPVRLGKERQFGLDPLVEWSWEISTTEEPAFAIAGAEPSPLPRSSQWLTLGLRANAVAGLFLDAGVDIGLVSPNFEYGPPVPPWQVMLGLGWSFDPNPVVKEVEVASSNQPPPAPHEVLEGRIIGQVVDPQGKPVADARILFPGLAASAILTDAGGSFTSYRFPAGEIPIQVVVNDQVVKETTAQVSDNQDTQITISLDDTPAAATGRVSGAFTDEAGKPIAVRMHVVGQGVDEGFDANAEGLILLELYAGDYRATLSAPGYADKSITFTVPANGEIRISEKLALDKPPDTPLVSGTKNSIRVRRKIRYDGNEVAASSHEVLDQVAAFLIHHPEYQLVEIAVHTDDRGAAQKRSDARAASVRDYLIGKGVSPDRLEAKGYGASRPVAVNLTSQGRAKNNRTVFTVKKSN